jgi:hypothetical protein
MLEVRVVRRVMLLDEDLDTLLVLIVLLAGLELLFLYAIVISFVSQAAEFSYY